jgi:hypothetical protein
MALKPTIKACSVEDCTKLRVTDTTGAYNNPNNLTGWGAPNIDPDDTGFSATIVVNNGDPINMLNYGFPTSVVTTPAVDAFGIWPQFNPGGPITLYNGGTQITATNGVDIQASLGSLSGIAAIIQAAFNAYGSGFKCTYDAVANEVVFTAPLGSGTTYNASSIWDDSTGPFPGQTWAALFGGVNAFTETIYGPITGDFTFDDITVSLPDGWNTITYTLDTTATSPVSVTIKIFTYCKIKCCVFNKMLEMNDFDICKDTERIASLMHMWNLYNSMLYSANGCSESQATEILTRLQQLCEVDDTTSGCGCS